MIENANESKVPSASELIDIKKWVGVASVNIVAINPNNAKLRSFGWEIAEGAEEPEYVYTKERDGKMVRSARVRFLVQIQDFKEKPVVPMDFWISPDYIISTDGSKGKIIDSYGRTAWATKEEIKARKIPRYSSGEANISSDYTLCHRGQEELISFLMKYLNVSPYQIFDRKKNDYVVNTNPGKLTIDDWDKLCEGDVTELVQYIALQPKNCVKVIFGVQLSDENRAIQVFLRSRFIGNGLAPDKGTGDYPAAQKAIDKWVEEQLRAEERNPNYVMPNVTFAAVPVKEWSLEATDVQEESVEESTEEGVSEEYDLPF